jgi:hypothetical protein
MDAVECEDCGGTLQALSSLVPIAYIVRSGKRVHVPKRILKRRIRRADQ